MTPFQKQYNRPNDRKGVCFISTVTAVAGLYWTIAICAPGLSADLAIPVFLLFKPRISFSHLQGTQSAVSSFKSSFVDDQYVRELSSRAFFNAGGMTLGLLPSSPSSLGNPFLAHLALLLAVTLHRLPSLGPSDNNITTERRASSVTRSAHYFAREDRLIPPKAHYPFFSGSPKRTIAILSALPWSCMRPRSFVVLWAFLWWTRPRCVRSSILPPPSNVQQFIRRAIRHAPSSFCHLYVTLNLLVERN